MWVFCCFGLGFFCRVLFLFFRVGCGEVFVVFWLFRKFFGKVGVWRLWGGVLGVSSRGGGSGLWVFLRLWFWDFDFRFSVWGRE